MIARRKFTVWNMRFLACSYLSIFRVLGTLSINGAADKISQSICGARRWVNQVEFFINLYLVVLLQILSDFCSASLWKLKKIIKSFGKYGKKSVALSSRYPFHLLQARFKLDSWSSWPIREAIAIFSKMLLSLSFLYFYIQRILWVSGSSMLGEMAYTPTYYSPL